MRRRLGGLVVYITVSLTFSAMLFANVNRGRNAASGMTVNANVEQLRHSPLPAPNPGDGDGVMVAHSPLPAPNPGDGDGVMVAHSPLPAPNPGDGDGVMLA
jgi:hypothetical protein